MKIFVANYYKVSQIYELLRNALGDNCLNERRIKKFMNLGQVRGQMLRMAEKAIMDVPVQQRHLK